MTETGELPVYPMTAIDEITTKTPDALYNGSAVVDIIASCIPNIKQPWKITSVDLDAILVAIKIATNGNEMEIETKCDKCDETSKFGVNLSIVLNNFKSGDYESGLVIDQLKIKFKPLNYKSLSASSIKQFEIQKKIKDPNINTSMSLSSSLLNKEKVATEAEIIELLKPPMPSENSPLTDAEIEELIQKL